MCDYCHPITRSAPKSRTDILDTQPCSLCSTQLKSILVDGILFNDIEVPDYATHCKLINDVPVFFNFDLWYPKGSMCQWQQSRYQHKDKIPKIYEWDYAPLYRRISYFFVKFFKPIKPIHII